MKLIYRYLMGALLRGFALTGTSLLALFGLFDFMERAGGVGDGSFDVGDALMVTALILPIRLVDLSPFIALLGVVYGLSTFVRSHELIAMRAAALTPLRLAALCAVATLGFFVVIAAAEFVSRPMAQQAHLLQMAETSQDGALFSKDGIWIEHDGLFVNVESLARSGAPSGIHLYDFGDDTVLDRYLSAESAALLPDGSWALQAVDEKVYLASGAVETRTLDGMTWMPPWRQTTALYELPLESLSLADIDAHRRYLAREQRPTGIYAVEFWRRVLTPASGIVFALFAAPFVLGVGPRASMGGSVTLGVAIALGMYLLQQIGTNALYLAIQSPSLAVGLPIVAVFAVAMLLIRRVNGAPR
jgi:lipopolysaccharide export system permease protein